MSQGVVKEGGIANNLKVFQAPKGWEKAVIPVRRRTKKKRCAK